MSHSLQAGVWRMESYAVAPQSLTVGDMSWVSSGLPVIMNGHVCQKQETTGEENKTKKCSSMCWCHFFKAHTHS